MKVFLIATFFWLSSILHAQVPKEFNPALASDLIRLCTSYTFLDLYSSDKDIIPVGYNLIYTSTSSRLDNKFQVYLKDSLVVLNFRGSTADPFSWLENLHAAMIPANDVIRIDDEVFQYSFAQDTSAAVHGGYALGLAYIYEDLFDVIDSLNTVGYHDFIITGHSQGGAIANMFRALLENLPAERFPANNNYLTYAFAAPMIGNKTFVNEYNRRYCNTGTSFNVVNPEDGIPSLPSSFNDSSKIIYDNIVLYLTKPEEIKLKYFLKDASYLLVGKALTNQIHKVGESIINRVSHDPGEVVLPEYIDDINYHYVGNVVHVPSVNYPEIAEDSLVLVNGNYRTTYNIIDYKKYFPDKNAISEPSMFQHKPYNYYVAVLLRFFPEQYLKLDKKFLGENL